MLTDALEIKIVEVLLRDRIRSRDKNEEDKSDDDDDDPTSIYIYSNYSIYTVDYQHK